MLTGGAVLLGGAVLATEGTAEASNGKTLILGRTNNTSSATTTLTSTSKTKALYVNNTNAGKSAHAVVGKSVSGIAVAGESAKGIAGSFVAHGQYGTALYVGKTYKSPYGPAVEVACKNGTAIRASGAIEVTADEALFVYGNAETFGDVHIKGTVSKGGGSFKIDHPQDPANKYLYHSFVESPDMMNVYNGTATADANGEADIELPGWFESLNRDFRYQLTAIGGPAPDLHIKSKVTGNRFTIAGARAKQEIAWQLTGIRQDAWANDHRIPVEETKPADERGTYLHPESHGKSAEVGLQAQRLKRVDG